MTKPTYRRKRALDIEEEYDKVDIIRHKVKKRKKLFSILVDVPVNKMTLEELNIFEDSLTNLYVSTANTPISLTTLCRIFGLDDDQYIYLLDNKAKLLEEIDYHRYSVNISDNQLNSVIFTPKYVTSELNNCFEDMYFLYLSLMPPDELCEYFRIFYIKECWDIQIKKLQERLKKEQREEVMAEHQRIFRESQKDEEIEQQILYKEKYENDKKILKEMMDKKKQDFLDSDVYSKKVKNKDNCVTVNGKEIELFGI